MDAERYREIINEQKEYYEKEVQKRLLAGRGVREDSPDYFTRRPDIEALKKDYYHEMRNAYDKGVRITVEGTDIMPGEFSAAAGLLAEGKMTRHMICGICAPESEYRMSVLKNVR